MQWYLIPFMVSDIIYCIYYYLDCYHYYRLTYHTVDGRYPAPPWMVETLTLGETIYQLMQYLFHPPYLHIYEAFFEEI